MHTKLGADILGSAVRKNLETFYAKASNSADRARCLELLTSLDLGEALRKSSRRSASAVPSATPSDAQTDRRNRPAYRRSCTAVPFLSANG